MTVTARAVLTRDPFTILPPLSYHHPTRSPRLSPSNLQLRLIPSPLCPHCVPHPPALITPNRPHLQVRETMVAKLKEEFADYNLTFSIGGQISFDLFPQGWDKTFCLKYLPEVGSGW